MRMNDAIFNEKRFEELEFSLRMISSAKNVRFVRCTVAPGTCVVDQGATLEKVVFEDLDCGDALRISSDACLREVTIRGDSPKSLIVQPDALANNHEPDEIVLDITGFRGNVSIVGFGNRSVRYNKQLHVAVDASWRERVDWSALDIGPFSYWRLYLKKLKAFEATQGVFSLPPRNDKHFSVTLDEMRKLRAFGLDLQIPENSGQSS